MKLKKEYLLLISVLLLSLLLRVLFPTIDSPSWSTGDLGLYADEGYKTLSAKNEVLFGQTHPNSADSYAGWSTLSPVTHFLFKLFFTLFGTGYLQARLINIILSLISVYLVYLIVKKAYSHKTALISAFFLGINISYLIYNKIALLETVLVFFLLLSIFCWQLSKKQPFYLIGSLLSFLLAFLVKPLAILFLPALLFMIYDNFKHLLHKKNTLLLIGGLLITGSIILLLFPQIISIFIKFLEQRHPGSLLTFAKLVVQFWYQDFFRLNTLLLFFFLGYLVSFLQKYLSKKKISSFEIVILLWALGGLALLILQTYRPPRYFVSIIPALCILASLFLVEKINYKYSLAAKLSFLGVAGILSLHFYYFSKLLSMPLIIYALLALFFFLISFFIVPKLSFTTKLRKFFIYAYVIFNLLLIIVWFSSQSYQLLHASQDLETIVGPQDVVFGVNWVPALCLNTELECYHVSGYSSESIDSFRLLNVSYFITDSFEQLEQDKVPFYFEPYFYDSLTYIKSYSIGRFNVSLYKFNQTIYYQHLN